MKKITTIGLPIALMAVLTAGSALAQGTPAPTSSPTIPAETVKAETATTGKTEVAKGGFATSGLPAEDDPTHATEAAVAAGGLFTSGNARTVALTSSGPRSGSGK